jgi:hypothetical protein
MRQAIRFRWKKSKTNAGNVSIMKKMKKESFGPDKTFGKTFADN